MDFSIIEMKDFNCDGCGSEVSVLVIVKTNQLNQNDQNNLQKIVDALKEEWEDWQFDEIVEEACEKYFKEKNIDYKITNPDFTIEL